MAAVVAEFDSRVVTPTDNSNPMASFAGCIIRTAGHDFMDFRTITATNPGGSDGCINFEDEDNKGLAACLVDTKLPDIYQNYCS